MARTQNQREKEDMTRDFAVGVVGNLIAALLVFLVNVLGARFLPAAWWGRGGERLTASALPFTFE